MYYNIKSVFKILLRHNMYMQCSVELTWAIVFQAFLQSQFIAHYENIFTGFSRFIWPNWCLADQPQNPLKSAKQAGSPTNHLRQV